MKYLILIDSCYGDLTKSEKKVASYIKKVKQEIIYQSISQVTENTKVGEATVVRFCKKLGFEGFQDMKLAVAKEEMPPKSYEEEGYFEEVANLFVKAIDESMNMISDEDISVAVSMIEKADNINVMGSGLSALAAEEMAWRFTRLGKKMNSVRDNHLQAIACSLMTKGDLLIVFSLSGRTKETYENILLAKEQGATILAVTSHILSPIAKESDRTITSTLKESILEGGSLHAKVSQLYIIDVLATKYRLNNEKESMIAREKVAKAVINRTIK